MLDRREVILFDVRPEDERAIASIAGARSFDAAGQEYLFGLDRGTPIAFHCHHRIRSQEAAQQLLREGFRNVHNVKGGVGVLMAAQSLNLVKIVQGQQGDFGLFNWFVVVWMQTPLWVWWRTP